MPKNLEAAIDAFEHGLSEEQLKDPAYRMSYGFVPMTAKKCPARFEDEDYFEPDERPINGSSIADVVSAVVTDPAVKGLQDRLRAMEKTQQVLIWMLGLVLLVLIVQRWS